MQSGFRTSQYEEPLVQIRMVREPVTAIRRRGGPTGPIRHWWMVHDPRSPCEGSRRAVHLVVLVEKLQETLVDGVRVTTRKSFAAPSNPILPDEKSSEQIDSV